MTASPRFVPELDVDDLEASIAFYTQVCGFVIRYHRVEDQFVSLGVDGVELLLQSARGPGRRFRTASMEHPYGRGVNFQLEVDDVDAVHARAERTGAPFVVPLEERWYRVDDHEVGNRQFVVADPDGYLVRPFQDLGRR